MKSYLLYLISPHIKPLCLAVYLGLFGQNHLKLQFHEQFSSNALWYKATIDIPVITAEITTLNIDLSPLSCKVDFWNCSRHISFFMQSLSRHICQMIAIFILARPTFDMKRSDWCAWTAVMDLPHLSVERSSDSCFSGWNEDAIKGC